MLFFSAKLLCLNTSSVISESGSEGNCKTIGKDCKIDLDEE